MPVPDNAYPESIVVDKDSIDHPRAIELPLNTPGPGGANLLCVYTGVAVGTIQGNGRNWRRFHYYVRIPTGAQWRSGAIIYPGEREIIQATALATPSSLYNVSTADYAGWAVDAAYVTDPNTYPDDLILGAHVAVSDVDGYLFRLGYQITVLARVA